MQTVCEGYGAAPTDVAAVGLGVPGDFDPNDGSLRSCPNLPSLVGSRPADLFARAALRRWGSSPQVAADNDTVVAVLGEAHWGAGRGVQRVLYMTVSTGVGGARFDGRRWYNLEPGLRVYPLSEAPHRCLEELAGGAHMARRAAESLAEWHRLGGLAEVQRRTRVLDHPELRDGTWGERLGRLTARHLGESAADGDAWCRTLFRRTAHVVAKGLAVLLDQGWGEERIVLGGSIALRVPRFFDHVQEALRRLQEAPGAPASRRRLPIEELVTAGLGEERGVLGAALLASWGGVSRPRSGTPSNG